MLIFKSETFPQVLAAIYEYIVTFTGKATVSSLSHLYYLSVDSHHQHRPEADVSHLISVPPGFPGPS
jgi:hypothetical protein